MPIYRSNKVGWGYAAPYDLQTWLDFEVVDNRRSVTVLLNKAICLAPRQMRCLARWLLWLADDIEAARKPRKPCKKS